MGMTRRLNHIDAESGWHALLVVAAIGAGIITLALFLQILQVLVSVIKRKELIAGQDPWNARTLEWSIPSPVPFYNFKTIPAVTGRDAFWMQKESGIEPTIAQEEIFLPKNTPIGFSIGALGFFVGFGIIWHIWWLVSIALVAIVACLMVRAFQAETEYRVSEALL
jgi:cytochrome o ubiquinol oxidase subunit 1